MKRHVIIKTATNREAVSIGNTYHDAGIKINNVSAVKNHARFSGKTKKFDIKSTNGQ